jgi:cytochrome c556
MSGELALYNMGEKDLSQRIEHVEGLMVKMSGKLEKIYDVVVGNETFDQEGVLSRIKKLEGESKKLNDLKNRLIGAFVAGGAVWTVIWEIVKKFILKN